MKQYLEKFLESGLVMAAVMGLLYYLTYLMLYGALKAYALPDDLIDIGIPDIIATLVNLIYDFWPVMLVPVFGLLLTKGVHDAELLRLARFTMLLLTCVAFSIALTERFELDNLILLGICVFEWLESVTKALVRGGKQRSFIEKWGVSAEIEANKTDAGKTISGIAWIALAIAVMFVLSNSVMEHAVNQERARETYFMAEDYDNKLVVFQNDSQYVLMERKGDKLLPAYELVQNESIGGLHSIHTGKLTLQEKAFPEV